MAFKSKYSPGPRAGFNPKTGAKPQMKRSVAGGVAGSMANAAAQIKQSPQPFSGGGALKNTPPVHTGFGEKQVQGSSAGGTRPRANTAAAPRSEPMGQSQGNQAVGYPQNYQADYNPSTHSVARAKPKVRVMRGAVPGSKPLIDNSDLFSPESIKDWNRNARGL